VAGSKRERELARAKYERQQARRAQSDDKRRKRTQVIASVVIGALVLAGFAALAVSLRHKSASTSAAAVDSNRAVCLYSPSGTAARKVTAPDVSTSLSPATKTATLALTQGTVTIELLNAKAPCTVNSFAHLAKSSYYANTPCHRLTTSSTLKVLQCGDPTGTGSGGPGYSFADENLTGATYPAGTVAMANSGPNTNGSQFFLVYGDSQLPAQYTPFGKVTGGLDVLHKIAAAGVKGGGEDGAPTTPVTLKSVTVEG
jgi:peptidyl-prolyl cis-trans isomerase B (cyclophilin B)